MARFGELFAGIGGLSAALEMHGHEPAWFAEKDADAATELARKYPDVPNHGDVKEIDYSKLEQVEILVGGGWPCQPFSPAGKRGGMDDERYLWPEVARALRALRPRVFIMEQVPDILDERRFPGVFSRCLADLAEAGMDARWGCLRSSDVGAPHRRERLFLVAHARRSCVQRRTEPGGVRDAEDAGAGKELQRQRGRDAACDEGSSAVTDPSNQRREDRPIDTSHGLQAVGEAVHTAADSERIRDDGGGAQRKWRPQPPDGCCRRRRQRTRRARARTVSIRESSAHFGRLGSLQTRHPKVGSRSGSSPRTSDHHQGKAAPQPSVLCLDDGARTTTAVPNRCSSLCRQRGQPTAGIRRPVSTNRWRGRVTAGRALVLRSNALELPLSDESVDLIITSPPYFALRSYQDAGDHYEGQIGSEPTPREFLEALWAATREMVRVLKPTGSIFVNLGDKYAGSGGANNLHLSKAGRRGGPASYNRHSGGVPAKSLMGLPWRYALGCIDGLGLILRAEIVWSKPNGLPESVNDRVRRSHEQWFHFTKEQHYFSAVDEVREPHAPWTLKAYEYEQKSGGYNRRKNPDRVDEGNAADYAVANPLGKLPGSVWTIASEPLKVPVHLGIDHFAAFPTEWPRRLVLGWSPSGICVRCGEGRRPIVQKELVDQKPHPRPKGPARTDLTEDPSVPGRGMSGDHVAGTTRASIIGHACACTPFTDHEGRGKSSRRDRVPNGQETKPQGCYSNRAGEYERVGPSREYHFDQWTPPDTRPAVVLDPFGGTGTVALIAKTLGRIGISVDLSNDYCRLADWRIHSSGHGRKALAKTWAERQTTLVSESEGAA